MKPWSVCALATSAMACGGMQRQWDAQQTAQAQAEAAAQPANMEQLCRPAVNAYCARCSVAQEACGQVYVQCLGTSSPADPSVFTMGQVDQCVADVNAGDCSVMPGVWPASCSAQSPPTEPAATCSGGAMWDGSQCACPTGTWWNGALCDSVQPTASACPGGATWDGSQCVCPQSTTWRGSECVAVRPPRSRSGNACRSALLGKGYAPDQMSNCEGVDDRCAVALIGRGFAPDQLASCRGVRGDCAEQVLARGFGPDQLANCRR